MCTLDSIIAKIKNNPLFYISLTSKELFHSNFWYWLSTLNKEATLKIFVESHSESNSLFFKREHKQSKGSKKQDDLIKSVNDLVVFENENPIIVIENKVKDYPTVCQLDRIKKSFNGQNVKFVLVTLWGHEEIKFEDWIVIRYKDIANNIQTKLYSMEDYCLNKLLIDSYKDYCNNLHDLVERLPITDNYDFIESLNPELFNKLESIKLTSGYKKLRASDFFLKYEKPFDCLVCGYGINNQQATLDFKYPLDSHYFIGVQVEGKQFRIFVEGTQDKLFAENLAQNELFFDKNFRSIKEKKSFLHYDPNFTYQYKIPLINEVLTYNKLSEKINEKLIYINNNLEEIRNQIPN